MVKVLKEFEYRHYTLKHNST